MAKKNKKEKDLVKINWIAGLVDIFIIIMAVVISVWQNNPKYLWLLLCILGTGSYKIVYRSDEDD